MPSEARGAMDLMWSIREFGWRPTVEQWNTVLSWTDKYVERQWLDGAASRDHANKILSLVWINRGDALRETGRPIEAAAAYARSVEFCPQICVFDNYCKIVLKHNLADHYRIVLELLPSAQRCAQSVPRTIRASSWIWTGLRHPFIFFHTVKEMALRKKRIDELQWRLKNGQNKPNTNNRVVNS